MNYYPFHVGDYRRDTHYLTHEGHYIYRTLLDEYYHSELPLPLDKRLLLRQCGLTTDQLPLLEDILTDFFNEGALGYVNKHCERVISEYKARIEQASIAGTASAKARQLKRTGVKRALKSSTTDAAQKSNGCSTNQEPRTNNQSKESKPKKNGRFAPPSVDEVQTYLNEKGITSFTGEKFVAHYAATDWYRGKNKIKSWKHCVTTWVSNRDDDKPQSTYAEGAI